MNTVVERISLALLNSRYTVALTGAGISTESGIPDYRGTSGQFWGKYDSRDSHISNFINNSGSRMRCWEVCATFYQLIRDAHPNLAHLALAELEQMKLLRGIITQNVDGLHQKAGNRPKTIVEIHGTAHLISCLDCGRKYASETIYDMIARGVKVPYCECCQGILKPDTVFPGEAIASNVARRALKMVESSKILIVIGSSLEVQPAAYLPVKAKEAGAKLVIINLTSTPYDKYADYLIHDSANHTLGKIMKRVKSMLYPERVDSLR
ncbi:MAG TPA: SIR2 family NAD-dependent protein deacylase [Candidatus Avalokitesvara rifleensis]|uniref:SIR2 family NAD-dependent protein deacylase n=1 Tax=Candidatus Avalokitesvara rifleensis TaxID=3367620 RepID=UPI002712B164|nr:Sir2 family NAD-dependent protein deacetylase [Candidatus Brocadiales bacterium]